MTVLYTDSPYDTAESTALRDRINADSDAFHALERGYHVRARAQCAAYDELLGSRRPSYPTPGQLAALDDVADLVLRGQTYGDDFGRPTDDDILTGHCLPDGVRYRSTTRNLQLEALAPFSAVRPQTRLWTFFPEEEWALRDAVQRRGLRITSEWRYDDGLGFVVDTNR